MLHNADLPFIHFARRWFQASRQHLYTLSPELKLVFYLPHIIFHS